MKTLSHSINKSKTRNLFIGQWYRKIPNRRLTFPRFQIGGKFTLKLRVCLLLGYISEFSEILAHSFNRHWKDLIYFGMI